MPTYIIRRSPEREEYLLWSTVVDAPTSRVLTRQEALDYASAVGGIDEDLAAEQGRRRIQRVDEQGSTEQGHPYYGYGQETFWWRERAPEDVGRPFEIEDQPGLFIGRELTRDELFDVMAQAAQ